MNVRRAARRRVAVAIACTTAVFLPHRASAAPHQGSETVGGRNAAAGEVLVRYRQPQSGSQLSSATAPDVDVERPVGRGGWHLIHSRTRSAGALVADFAARADVAAVEPNYEVHAGGTPNDLVTALWGLHNTGQALSNGDSGTPGADIGAVSAWNETTGSPRVVVATVDTGIMASHQDLAANVWSAPASFTVTIGGTTVTCPAGSHGFNAIAMTCDPADDNGHGTHVAGSIGAAGNNNVGVVGVNWTASIMALKFLDSSGNGYVSDAIDAIDFAIQAKQAFASSGGANVRILNNSWDGGGFSQAMADEIQKAADADMLFVAAAGNSSADIGASPEYPASYQVSNVVAVGATDYRDQLASFSNYGQNAVHIAAPGSLIYSTTISTADPTASNYTTMSGTSMATAYVSGAAALVLAHCSYSTGALRSALLASATSLPSLSSTIQSGRRLNAAAAVASCDQTTSASPSDVVLYASDIPAPGLHGAWSLQSDATAANDTAAATPDAGWSATSAPLASPADFFETTFSAPAGVPYHVWVRLRAANDSKYNDSVWVQFSDALASGTPVDAIGSTSALLVNLENCSGCGVSGWGWQDGAYWLTQAAVVTFASSGTHTVRVQTREDGALVDQIVLSPSTYLSSSPGLVMNDSTIVPKSSGSSSTTSPPPSGPTPFSGSPAAIPGTVQTENFDNGGEGVAYHDTTAGNSGGAYRQTDVDIESASGGGYDVGWVAAGEWLNYTVKVSAAGSYTAQFRVASSGQGGTFHLEMNGVNVTGSMTIPDTGGWQNWQTISKTVSLSAGQQSARLVMDTGGAAAVGNFDSITFSSAVPSLPGTIQAADYDTGGEGVSYHDTTPGNAGGAYRQDDVDIEACSEGGYDVGWIAAGEWLNYTVNVPAAGTYTVDLRVASPSGGGSMHVGFNTASNVWTTVSVPATGGWQNWTTVSVPVTLGAGVQQITLLFDTAGFNISRITVR